MRQVVGVLASLTAAAVLDGCMGTDQPIIPAGIDRLQAYYCAVPNQTTCSSRGDPIPAGTLPPVNEAFEVWAFYRGWLSTHWRLDVMGDSVKTTDKFLPDSVNVYVYFGGGGGSFYTIHVFVQSAGGLVSSDSLRWNYSTP
jgi:hypothetical protein